MGDEISAHWRTAMSIRSDCSLGTVATLLTACLLATGPSAIAQQKASPAVAAVEADAQLLRSGDVTVMGPTPWTLSVNAGTTAPGADTLSVSPGEKSGALVPVNKYPPFRKSTGTPSVPKLPPLIVSVPALANCAGTVKDWVIVHSAADVVVRCWE